MTMTTIIVITGVFFITLNKFATNIWKRCRQIYPSIL